MQRRKYSSLIAATFLFAFGAGSVYADMANVTNTVDLRASTGGNHVSPGGHVETGSVSASITIDTETYGDMDSHIYISTTTTSSVDLHIQNGSRGEDGADGRDGEDGVSGVEGTNGADGKNGQSGNTASNSDSHKTKEVVKTHIPPVDSTSVEKKADHPESTITLGSSTNDLPAAANESSFKKVTHYFNHFFRKLTLYVSDFFTKK